MQTFSLTFDIPETLSIAAQNATQNWGDLFIRTYHGSQGATYWIDNVQIVPEPATLTMLAVGGLMSLKRRRT